jgi:hypothetical protein
MKYHGFTDCLDLLEVVPGSCSETGAILADDGNRVISIKVEVTEEDPMPISCSVIKGEHKVSTLYKYPEFPFDFQIFSCISAFKN